MTPNITLGIENLLHYYRRRLKGRRVGLITNPTGVNAQLRSTVDLLLTQSGMQVQALFGPEHGVRGDAQDAIQIASERDAKTGLVTYSLYGEHRKPTQKMLKGLDLLIYDIQDVGVRYYTYPYTLSYVMEAAAEHDLEVMVLDRPNPLGGRIVEGPLLDPALSSFVGRYPIPVRHGLTIGELAQYINTVFGIHCRLTVIPMRGWRRSSRYDQTGLFWIAPSPNIPTYDTVVVYPGMCLFEGTNLSEGRGTTHPFEWIGAPWVDGTELAHALNRLQLPGVLFRPHSFTPIYSKHTHVVCHGVQIHVSDRRKLRAFEVGLHIIATLIELYPQSFEFLPTSWEARPPHFDLLCGDATFRARLLAGEPVAQLAQGWQRSLRDYQKYHQEYWLYH